MSFDPIRAEYQLSELRAEYQDLCMDPSVREANRVRLAKLEREIAALEHMIGQEGD